MRQFITRKSIVGVLIALVLVTSFVGVGVLRNSTAHAAPASPKVSSTTNNHPICQRLGHSIQASSGAQMWCFGSQPNGPAHTPTTNNPSFGSNVDAANPREDITPSGLQAYGQSETSIAAIDSFVVEAWNDSTGFFTNCGAPMNKEELTGYGFSSNGGKSFKDEGGLPNTNCNDHKLFGDPSVETWRSGGSDYFYVSSLYLPSFSATDQRTFLAINACKATGTGSTASISCGQPIIAASSTECTSDGSFCSFLDKEFLSIDPQRGRLYMSYTEFGINFGEPLFNGAIELAACDIGNRNGTPGPQGGTAGQPVCFPGNNGTSTSPGPAYFVINPGDINCENEGAYPAVDLKTGAVYVAWEFNWASNIFGPSACFSQQTQNKVSFVPQSCLTLPTASCSGPARTTAVNIRSMSGAFIPGYNRFPMNDFPRIAVSDVAGTVSIVWNDARLHPFGNIFLQSFATGSLGRIQSSPVHIDSGTGGWHFLPALRRADAQGRLDVSFYCRSDPNNAITNVCAAKQINPRTTSNPGNNRIVTTGPSNWNAVSSDIVPNFGDYTDNYLIATGSAPFVGNILYVAWSDGRLGDPQPFNDHFTE